MVAPYFLSNSSVIPAGPETAFAVLIDVPLEQLFTQRGGLIPAVKGTRGTTWAAVGDTRTVELADGSTNTETLVGLDTPRVYNYELSNFNGPLNLLASTVEGSFTFAEEGTGTRVTWTWTIHPRHRAARLAMPALGASWRKFGDNMWPNWVQLVSA
ncbi:SRPBCC family protein [Demetria terragena]|uniref:SRPBCC family protein n=1 Tax=Demetria terragena TaxID=63959 RepID=UPI0003818048|nr:SRPBCC family protein [Demetria terragena]